MPLKDLEKRREYMRNYVRTPEDKDVVKERNKKHYQANKKEFQAVAIVKAKKRREEHPDKVKEEKTRWRKKTPEKQRQYSRAAKKRSKMRIAEYFGGCCCAYCGLKDDPCIYDCHHLDPSTKEFGIGMARGKSWEEITKELDKCVLLCSNCHRKVHSGVIELEEKHLR
jgi:hypothetical protein